VTNGSPSGGQVVVAARLSMRRREVGGRRRKKKRKRKEKETKIENISRKFWKNKKWRFINFLKNLAMKVTRHT